MTDQLSLDEGRILIQMARQAITNHLNGKKIDSSTSVRSRLSQPSGVFITLIDTARTPGLRGCIGNPFPRSPLLEETMRCAIDAATQDPRFDPMSYNEFAGSIAVEVTVLSKPEDIIVKSPLDLPLNVEVGRDGLVVSSAQSRGLLLPQVAVDEGFDAEEFLGHCCMKAGLTPDAWVTGNVRVARFQGQIFSEETPQGRVFERKLERDKE